MSRLTVRCERCGTRFFLRDNGFEDPVVATWCPRCGSKSVELGVIPAGIERREDAA